MLEKEKRMVVYEGLGKSRLVECWILNFDINVLVIISAWRMGDVLMENNIVEPPGILKREHIGEIVGEMWCEHPEPFEDHH